MSPDPGKLTERLSIETAPSGVDALGQRVEGWTELVECWGRAQPIRGTEFFAAGQTQAESMVRFTIRYRTDVTREMRVVWNGIPHAIVGDPINVNGQRVWLELMCSAGIRDGR